MRPIYEFRVPDYAHGYFSKHFTGLLFRLSLRMCVYNFKFLALPILYPYPQNLGSPWIRPRSLFSKIYNGLLLDALAKFEVRSFTRS